jgi:adenosine deaminase
MRMLNTLITRLPKCEMHIHIEGSLEPEPMFAHGLHRAIEDADKHWVSGPA